METKDTIAYIMCVLAGISMIFFLGFVTGAKCSYSDCIQKGAMEVYRGNTTMQYSIVDSVKVDSCVIFLNK